MVQNDVDEQEQLDDHDWDVTPDGLYIATRGFLARRGYCCANKCRNCPYINWRENSEWRPVPHNYVRRMHVSAKAIMGARTLLQFHKEQLETREEDTSQGQEWHEMMMRHYQFLLERWT